MLHSVTRDSRTALKKASDRTVLSYSGPDRFQLPTEAVRPNLGGPRETAGYALTAACASTGNPYCLATVIGFEAVLKVSSLIYGDGPPSEFDLCVGRESNARGIFGARSYCYNNR